MHSNQGKPGDSDVKQIGVNVLNVCYKHIKYVRQTLGTHAPGCPLTQDTFLSVGPVSCFWTTGAMMN